MLFRSDRVKALGGTEVQVAAALLHDTIEDTPTTEAQLRAEFELLNGIRKADGEVTQDQVDLYVKLRETMGAQQALVAAGGQIGRVMNGPVERVMRAHPD